MSQPAPHHASALNEFRRRGGIVLGTWIGLGLLAMLLLPAARGFSEWFGWLPFWLLFAPLSSVLALHRGALTRAVQARVRRPAPRTRRVGVQARRTTRNASISPLRASLAALWLR